MRPASILIFLLLQFPTAHLFAQSAQERRAALQQKLSRLDQANLGELLDQAAKDPDAEIRRLILQRVGRLDKPEVLQALERHAATDPDPEIALWSLERLRIQQARRLQTWKIVYGHHPIYSYGAHGDTPALQRSLLPLLRNRAQVYLVGHEHLAQHLQPEDGVHFLVAPAAGQATRPVKTGPRTLFADSFYGFVLLEVSTERIRAAFVDTEGKVRYQTEIRRGRITR